MEAPLDVGTRVAINAMEIGSALDERLVVGKRGACDRRQVVADFGQLHWVERSAHNPQVALFKARSDLRDEIGVSECALDALELADIAQVDGNTHSSLGSLSPSLGAIPRAIASERYRTTSR